jgi:hypothetical protein
MECACNFSFVVIGNNLNLTRGMVGASNEITYRQVHFRYDFGLLNAIELIFIISKKCLTYLTWILKTTEGVHSFVPPSVQDVRVRVH